MNFSRWPLRLLSHEAGQQGHLHRGRSAGNRPLPHARHRDYRIQPTAGLGTRNRGRPPWLVESADAKPAGRRAEGIYGKYPRVSGPTCWSRVTCTHKASEGFQLGPVERPVFQLSCFKCNPNHLSIILGRTAKASRTTNEVQEMRHKK